jgi:hypothetical protein
MRQGHRISGLVIVLLLLFALRAVASSQRVSATDLLSNKSAFDGKVISVDGFVRFDRRSQRGFLNKNLLDMRIRNYRQTIFLELGNENYASMKIPDGTYVLVTGYLSRELRGPLGVYAGHIIVDRIQPLRTSQRRSTEQYERSRRRAMRERGQRRFWNQELSWERQKGVGLRISAGP